MHDDNIAASFDRFDATFTVQGKVSPRSDVLGSQDMSAYSVHPGLSLMSIQATAPKGFEMAATAACGISMELLTRGVLRSVGVSHTRQLGLVEGVVGLSHADQPERWRTMICSESSVECVGVLVEPIWLEANHRFLFECGGATIRHLHVEEVRVDPQILASANALLHSPYRGPLRALYTEGFALQFVASVFSRSSNSDIRPFDTLKDRRRIQRAHNVRDWMALRLDEEFRLGDIASALNVTVRQVQRDFLVVFGASPFAWLREQKLHRAVQQLYRNEATVTEAALDAGFRSPASFSRAVRRSFGTTPSELMRAKSLSFPQ